MTIYRCKNIPSDHLRVDDNQSTTKGWISMAACRPSSGERNTGKISLHLAIEDVEALVEQLSAMVAATKQQAVAAGEEASTGSSYEHQFIMRRWRYWDTNEFGWFETGWRSNTPKWEEHQKLISVCDQKEASFRMATKKTDEHKQARQLDAQLRKMRDETERKARDVDEHFTEPEWIYWTGRKLPREIPDPLPKSLQFRRTGSRGAWVTSSSAGTKRSPNRNQTTLGSQLTYRCLISDCQDTLDPESE